MADQVKKNVYLEALEDMITLCDMALKRLRDLDAYTGTAVSESQVKKDRRRAVLTLELNMASYCVLLRKMRENSMITYDDDTRMDINAVIHCTRFEYADGEISVWSLNGRERADAKKLLDFGQALLNA